MARIIQLIYPTTCVQPPIIPDYKRKPRLQFVDTDLLNHSLGLQGEMIALKNLNDFYRGRILQHLVTQQIQSLFDSPLYKPSFWVREKANSNAEVDFVFHHNKYIIPIEVKSGSHCRLRSLHQFIDITKYKYGVRLLANQLSFEKVTTPAGTNYFLMNLPYYLVTRIPEYIDWFITRYS